MKGMRGERGTSAPAAMNDTDYKLLDSVGEEEGLQSTRLRRTTIHEDAGVRRALLSEEYIWSYRNTIAFWAAILFQQGSVLFTIGSIALYPSILHVCDEGDKNVRRRLAGEDDCMPEFMFRAWVDYSFFIGAIAFTIGNYLVYFQVINSDKTSSSSGIKLVAKPAWQDLGHMGAIFNLFGSFLFNWNTALMFDTANHTSVWYEYNLVYVLSGGLGSIFFALGAIAEGEHNDWREIKNLKQPECQMAILNLTGSLLFLLAYLTEYNHFPAKHEELLIWLVATPFTVGSALFFIGSWMSVLLWKQQNFGLGYAKHVVGNSHVKVDLKQQIMMVIYVGSVCMQWERLGVCLSYNWGTYHNVYILEITFRLLVYHAILFLMSALHTTPDRPPFGVLLWSMRLICIYAFVGDVYLLRIESIDLGDEPP